VYIYIYSEMNPYALHLHNCMLRCNNLGCDVET